MTAPLRILVADDNPLNLRIATKLLRELGHNGVLVTNGEQALQALAGQPFDLVLLDVSMPVLDGESTLATIRQRERKGSPKVPVIMVTGHDQPSDRQHYLQAGADGYLAKPIESASLQREMQRVLQSDACT